MAYIIMAQQETGEECRANGKEYESRASAERAIDELCDMYPEWRAFWVEELKDMAYWMERMNDEYDDRG